MKRGLVVIAILLAPLAAGCRDSLAEPNTDVGLVVWVDVTPVAMHLTDTVTEVVVRLRVLNPSGGVIRIRSGGPPYMTAGDPVKSRGLWGSVRFGSADSERDAGPAVDWFGDSVYVFQPRSSTTSEKRLKLKQWTMGGFTLKPGDLRVRGWFNGREGREAKLTILP